LADGSVRELQLLRRDQPFGQGAGEISVSAKANRLAYTLPSGGNNNNIRAARKLAQSTSSPVKPRAANCILSRLTNTDLQYDKIHALCNSSKTR
jgi:hypothetical protein